MYAYPVLVTAAALASTFVVAAPSSAAAADFSVTLTGPESVEAAETFLYEVVIRHEGEGSGSTTLGVVLPPHLFVTGRSTGGSGRGSCASTHHTVDCSFEKISGNTPATVSIGVYAGGFGTGTTSATLGPDTVMSNNTASVTTTVVQPPPTTQTFSAPYEDASGYGYGMADATTGRIAITVQPECILECRGAAWVDQRLQLSGAGPRSVDVEVVVDVEQLRKSVDAGADADVRVTLFRSATEHRSCALDLDPLLQAPTTGRVIVPCSWPVAVNGGSWLLVRAGLDVDAEPLVEAEAHGVISGITVSGSATSS